MKVSIITMTCTYNYGATLQAYALQEFVESMGHSCDIIDHMGWYGHRTIHLECNIDSFLKYPFKSKLEQGFKNFEDFYLQNMHMTTRYESIKALYNSPPDSDVFITGSDQVWNPRDLRGVFYLDFAPCQAKKVSYAASIGVPTIPEKKQSIIKEYLKNFDGISVRETSGYNAISLLTNKKVNTNCDPVYLLNRDKWRAIEKKPIEINDEYILCYMIYKPKWLNKWLREVRKKTDKKIVFIGLNGYRPVVCDYYVRNAGPREFIWLIDHASAVVSSSFHGIAFSVLFGKPIVAMPDPPRPDRIHNLLDMFDLEDNILYENKTEDCFKEYAYSKIERVISEQQNKSKKYFAEIFT